MWREKVKSRFGAIVFDDSDKEAIYIAGTDAPEQIPSLEVVYLLVERPIKKGSLRGLKEGGVYVAVNVLLEDLEESEQLRDVLKSHTDEFFKNEKRVPSQIKELVNITNSLILVPVREIGGYYIFEVTPILPSEGVKILEAQKRGVSIPVLDRPICDN